MPENLEVKAAVYRALDPLVPADTIVASDTSGIPITELQRFLSNPARLVGMHWSNPPHIIPMIEVIGGEKTAPQTVEAIVALIRSLGLLPVVVKKDVPGFVENRVLYALLREAIDLVERGVIDAEGLDTVVSWGIGYKLSVIGPMALLDMAGLDIYRSVSSFLNADLADRKDVSSFVTEKTDAGKLGIKSGEGLFSYTPERVAEPAGRARPPPRRRAPRASRDGTRHERARRRMAAGQGRGPARGAPGARRARAGGDGGRSNVANAVAPLQRRLRACGRRRAPRLLDDLDGDGWARWWR